MSRPRGITVDWEWSPLRWWAPSFVRFTYENHGAWALIFNWRLACGPLLVRSWKLWRHPHAAYEVVAASNRWGEP